MARSISGWIETWGVQARLLLRLAVGPELHVTLVIARAASQARMRRAGAGLFISRTER